MSDLLQEIGTDFWKASNGRDAQNLQTGRQWQERRELEERARKAIDFEKRLFVERFNERVAQAKQRIIDREAERHPTLKPSWFNQDKFNPQEIARKAVQEVHQNHAQRIKRINGAVERERAALRQQARAQNRIRGKASSEFHQRTDRRRR